MPLVWLSRCRSVMRSAYAGSSGMYCRTGSSIDSLPSCCNNRMLIAVNCFEIEPISNTVRGVIAMLYSRFAMPYPRAYASLPS